MKRLLRAARQIVRGGRYLAPRLAREPSRAATFLSVALGLPFERPPIVVGGCGRSGTSVLLSLLSAHPSIQAVPYATHAFARTLYSDRPDPEAPFEPWRVWWALTRTGLREGARRWCEKTAKNVVNFGRLASYFDGDVRLIHIVRDGRDVVTSKHRVDRDGYWIAPERWVRDVSAGLRHRHLECVHTVRYEDLVDSTEETLRRMGAFLGEDLGRLPGRWFHGARVQEFGPFDRRVARPLDDSSVGRWRGPEYRDRVERLLETPGARELLEELGYGV